MDASNDGVVCVLCSRVTALEPVWLRLGLGGSNDGVVCVLLFQSYDFRASLVEVWLGCQ